MNEEERTTQIGLAVRGDADALQRLLVDYHAPLHKAVEGKVDPSVRRHIDPDDVLQETYAAAFRAISGCDFDGPAAFFAWLRQIAMHELMNRQRDLHTQKRDVARVVYGSIGAASTYPDLVHRLAGPESTPSRKIGRSEATAAVLTSLARLSEGQRNVIRLRFLEGKSVGEVASVLGKTEEAVHGLCRRGLLALRKSLASISQFLTR